MSRVGIIAALPGELKPLVRGWQPAELSGGRRGDAAWRGRIGETDCIAVCAGMGRDAAARACGMAAASGELCALISLGWAGALSCGVYPGNSYCVAEVVNANTGERLASSFAPRDGPPLRLVTLDHVAQAPEKRRLAESYQAVLVDMEAATVARLAQAEGIAFYCFKAVSDEPGAKLPDFSRYTDAYGKLQMPALLLHLAVKPRYWPAMTRLGRNARIGASALASALKDFLGDGKHREHSAH